MKKVNWILNAVALALSLISTAHAGGNGAGNSGNAIEVDGKLYLLDLVEAGVYQHPYMENTDNRTESIRKFRARAEGILRRRLPEAAAQILIQKLLRFPGVQGDELLAIAELYQWKWVPGEVEEINGIESPLKLEKYRVYQAAYRRDSSILISQVIWDKLDVYNQAALLEHEIIYAAVRPTRQKDGTYSQRSWDARQIVGDSFTEFAPRDLTHYRRNGKPILTLSDRSDSDVGYRFSTCGETLMVSKGDNGSGVEVATVSACPSAILTYGNRSSFYFSLANNDGTESGNWYATIGAKTLLETACTGILNSGGKATLRNYSISATLSLEDYITADGVTKYAQTSLKENIEVYSSVISSDGHRKDSPGKYDLHYTTVKECMADLPIKLGKLALGFFR